MKNKDRIARSTPDFISHLNQIEARVFNRFTELQQDPSNCALFAFHGDWGHKMGGATNNEIRNAGGTEGFVRNMMASDPEAYRKLTIAFNLKRSFESQWRRAAGTLDTLNVLIDKPMIGISGLPNSPHNRLKLAYSAEEKLARPMYHAPPRMKLLPGGL